MRKDPTEEDIEASPAYLSQKQERFVQAFIANGGNASSAYRAAGYGFRTDGQCRSDASRLCWLPKIRARINEYNRIRARESNIQLEDKRQALWDIARACAELVEEPPTETEIEENGRTVILRVVQVKVLDPGTAIEAIRALDAIDARVEGVKNKGQPNTIEGFLEAMERGEALQ